ncbi:MAG: hypothetical protein GY856_39920 [bacterium]|nr:hypothetical protein [bacterium]
MSDSPQEPEKSRTRAYRLEAQALRQELLAQLRTELGGPAFREAVRAAVTGAAAETRVEPEPRTPTVPTPAARDLQQLTGEVEDLKELVRASCDQQTDFAELLEVVVARTAGRRPAARWWALGLVLALAAGVVGFQLGTRSQPPAAPGTEVGTESSVSPDPAALKPVAAPDTEEPVSEPAAAAEPATVPDAWRELLVPEPGPEIGMSLRALGWERLYATCFGSDVAARLAELEGDELEALWSRPRTQLEEIFRTAHESYPVDRERSNAVVFAAQLAAKTAILRWLHDQDDQEEGVDPSADESCRRLYENDLAAYVPDGLANSMSNRLLNTFLRCYGISETIEKGPEFTLVDHLLVLRRALRALAEERRPDE